MDNIGDIVKNVFKEILDQNAEQSCHIQDTWKNLLTVKERDHSRLEGMKAGFAVVVVDNPTWLYHMKTRKDYLLKEIQKKHPDIKQIRLKVGKI
ncbi:MAG: DUF721 domain-containing protein [Candidatus Moranbacteria bacterium]|nr:DUF721 domain-containing protein [Candidatus Moranbacteria bacterium]